MVNLQNERAIQTMIHEAAHAVVGHRLGGYIDEIRIAGNRAGYVGIDVPDVRNYAITCLAGMVAEEKSNKLNDADNYAEFFAGNRKHPYPASAPAPSDEDLAGVRRYVNKVSSWQLSERRLEATETYREVRRDARAMVDADWTTICDLAMALNDKIGDGESCVMSGADFRVFIGDK